jgi:hypothetical protein
MLKIGSLVAIVTLTIFMLQPNTNAANTESASHNRDPILDKQPDHPSIPRHPVHPVIASHPTHHR